ncbi:MAG: hypothetical protein AB7G11_11660 [Phycisphaerales bacterium]
MDQHSRDRSQTPRKPKKPYKDFPLFPHANGSWCKKINGKLVFFGGWGDPHGALEKYLGERESLHAGTPPPALTRRSPGPARSSPTVRRDARARVSGTVAQTEAKNAARANVPQRVASGPSHASKTDASAKAYDDSPMLRLAGTPRDGVVEPGAGVTVRDLCNHFLTAKERRLGRCAGNNDRRRTKSWSPVSAGEPSGGSGAASS